MSAQLSSPLAGMAVLQVLFLLFVLGPLFGQRLATRLTPEDAPPMFDKSGCHRLEQDAFRCGLNDGLCADLNLELLAQPSGNDNLAFSGEPDGIGFCYRAHAL